MARVRRWFWLPVLGLLALVLGLAQHVVPPESETPRALPVDTASVDVMVVGDSITQGRTGDWTWRYHFSRELAASVEMVGPRNDLYAGEGTFGGHAYADPAFDSDHAAQWGQAIFQAAEHIRADVRTEQPDHLLVLLGINDLIRFDRSAAQTTDALHTFIAEARAGRAQLPIILGTLLPTERARHDADFAARVAAFNTALRKIEVESSTEESPILIAETAAVINPRRDLYDGLHPNARGELRIAEAFVDALSRAGVGRPSDEQRTGGRA